MMTHLFRANLRSNITNSLFVTLMLCLSSAVYAEEWYSIAEDPVGKTTQPPVQLENYPLGKNTEKHFPPNMEFTLWTQDEDSFKPKENDRIVTKKVLMVIRYSLHL